MKAKIIFYELDEERAEKFENMGMPIPEAEKFPSEIYFHIDDVRVTYINREGDIALHTIVGTWVIPYNEKIWTKLKEHFND